MQNFFIAFSMPRFFFSCFQMSIGHLYLQFLLYLNPGSTSILSPWLRKLLSFKNSHGLPRNLFSQGSWLKTLKLVSIFPSSYIFAHQVSPILFYFSLICPSLSISTFIILILYFNFSRLDYLITSSPFLLFLVSP